MGNLLQDRGLTGLGRGYNQAALPQSDRGKQVHHPGGKVGAIGLQHQLFFREDGGQVFELGPEAGMHLVGLQPVDLLHSYQAEVAFSFFGRTHLAGYGVAGAEPETADLGLGYVNVAGGRKIGNLP